MLRRKIMKRTHRITNMIRGPSLCLLLSVLESCLYFASWILFYLNL